MYNELSIDFGSSNIVISAKNKGIINVQPCVALVRREDGKTVNFGSDALEKHASSPDGTVLDRPLIGGMTLHINRLQKLIALCVRNVCGQEFVPSRLLISVPCDVKPIEESAIIESALQLGIPEAYVIYSPLAAMIANEMDVSSSYLAVDIGASKTSIMIICRGNIEYCVSVDAAGSKFDMAISEYVYSKYGAKISSFTAESIKKKICTVWADDSPMKSIDVRTRTPDGNFSVIRLTGAEMFGALEEPTAALIQAIYTAISKIPTQYVNEIFSHGILLCGGGSLLGGLSKIIAGITGVDTFVFPNASDAVAIGMSEVLGLLPGKMSPAIRNVSKFCLRSMSGSAPSMAGEGTLQ